MDDYHSPDNFSQPTSLELKENKVRDLFRDEVFQALFYFDDWASSRNRY
jgi:hypothetical protein